LKAADAPPIRNCVARRGRQWLTLRARTQGALHASSEPSWVSGLEAVRARLPPCQSYDLFGHFANRDDVILSTPLRFDLHLVGRNLDNGPANGLSLKKIHVSEALRFSGSIRVWRSAESVSGKRKENSASIQSGAQSSCHAPMFGVFGLFQICALPWPHPSSRPHRFPHPTTRLRGSG